MPKGLKRYYGHEYLHFLTCGGYHRQPWLATARRRDLFLQILEEVRQRYGFVVVGYVAMPDHIHLLISEPERGTQSTVMQVLKQRYAWRVLAKKRNTAPALKRQAIFRRPSDASTGARPDTRVSGAGCPTSRRLCEKWALGGNPQIAVTSNLVHSPSLAQS